MRQSLAKKKKCYQSGFLSVLRVNLEGTFSMLHVARCLKITQNVAFVFFNFGLFRQFLTYLVTLFYRFRFSKYHQHWLILAFL